MGRESTISYEQVATAANVLSASGTKPTVRNVHNQLGTGSMGTVAKHLRTWRDCQVDHADQSIALPPALNGAIVDFLRIEIGRAKEAFEVSLADERQAATDLAAENERQSIEIDDQAMAIDSLRSEAARAAGRISQLTADLDSLREDASRERHAAEDARTELARVQLQLESLPRLEGDLASLRSELVNERQARVRAEQSTAVLSAQKSDLESRLEETKFRSDRAEKLAADISDVRVTLVTLQGRLAASGR